MPIDVVDFVASSCRPEIASSVASSPNDQIQGTLKPDFACRAAAKTAVPDFPPNGRRRPGSRRVMMVLKSSLSSALALVLAATIAVPAFAQTPPPASPAPALPATAAPEEKPLPPDTLLATVNGKKITQFDVHDGDGRSREQHLAAAQGQGARCLHPGLSDRRRAGLREGQGPTSSTTPPISVASSSMRTTSC